MEGTEYLKLGNKIILQDKEFFIKNPGISLIPDMFLLMKGFRGAMKDNKDANGVKKEVDAAEMFEYLDRESLTCLTNLIADSLQRSYPEWDDDYREEFGFAHAMDLMPLMMANAKEKTEKTSQRKHDIIASINNQKV